MSVSSPYVNNSTAELTDEQLRALYAWIDAIPLSRPKKNIARDFSDALLVAEIISAYFPQLVELHNYIPAHSVKQKVYNFETLNQRVIKKFGYTLNRSTIDDVVNCKPMAIEKLLNQLQIKMAKYKDHRRISAGGQQQQPVSPKGNKASDHRSAEPVYHNQMPVADAAVSASGMNSNYRQIDNEIILEKDRQIHDLQETVKILELKISKLEQLVRLKDNKIQKLTANANNGGF